MYAYTHEITRILLPERDFHSAQGVIYVYLLTEMDIKITRNHLFLLYELKIAQKMRFSISIGLTLCLAVSIPSIASTRPEKNFTIVQNVWKPVTSQAGKFTVLMPGKPVEEKESEDTGDGKIDSYSYTVEVSDKVAYLVQYTDFGVSLAKVDPKEFFDGAAEGLASDGGRILENKNITIAGIPAREVKYVDGQGIPATVRMLLIGDRFYQLHAITKQEADIKKFFDSFQIIK